MTPTDTLRHIEPLSGALDAEAAPEIRSRFDALLDTPHALIELDFTNVDFVDSSGIGAVVYLFKRLNEQQRQIALSNVGGQPLQLLELLRVDTILNITRAPEAA